MRMRLTPLLALLLLAGCAPSLATRIDASLTKASAYLASRQSPDGAWRSDVYGGMKDGPSLTPHVATAMYFIGPPDSLTRARRYLAGLQDSLAYPVYSAAAATWLMADPADRARWAAVVQSFQAVESLGWLRDDPEYGGFGYSALPPRKPDASMPRQPLASNISSTVYAVGALRAAGIRPDTEAFTKVLAFAQRCQNFGGETRYDDGGFFFTPSDPARNKAGPAGDGRFNSYGSATADGVRVLLHAGLPPDHPRVHAARRWLEQHFDPAHNPGTFAADREGIRDATYYYYAWSVSHAFLHLGAKDKAWAEQLAAELLARQNADGSWTNPYRDTKEDDPLIATTHAAAALVICRQVIAAGGYPSRHHP
jgi:hypothetical protein